MRATVRYLGSLAGESGQWVGVEVPEETIPVEAKKLSWNDGKKGEGELPEQLLRSFPVH
jgi:hypothetical protein